MLSPLLKKIEHIVDVLIPYALVVLIGILVIEFTRPTFSSQYHFIDYIDMGIVALFVVDLVFKYYHSKTIPQFLRSHWLEIIAVFPFFLIFRLLDGLGFLTFAAGEVVIKEGQGVTHALTAAEKEASVIGRTLSTGEKEIAAISRTVSAAEKEAVAISRTASTVEREVASIARLTRAQRLARFIKPIFDTRRTLHGTKFFEHPKHRTSA